MKRIFFAVIQIMCISFSSAQELEKVCPILGKHDYKNDSTSFLLTAFSYTATSIQIIDAQQPWPPRWFATHNYNQSLGINNSFILPANVSIQNEKMVFFSIVDTVVKGKKHVPPLAFVFLNAKLEPVDTFTGNNGELDVHDVRENGKGERLYFEIEDTTVSIAINGIQLNRVANDVIEITNAQGKVVFHWNPYVHLGINTMYAPYCCGGGRAFSSHIGGTDWALGSSVCFDFDGNILYSYRGVGIGKISRKDGSIMWRIDRNTQSINEESDIIPIAMQHDFKSIKDKHGNVIYTVLANGDKTINSCVAYQFTVNKDAKGKYIDKLVKKIEPSVSRPATLAGNYDVDSNGNYIFNYGFSLSDTALKGDKPLFEYGNEQKMLNEYVTQRGSVSFRIHDAENLRPARPVINDRDGWLVTAEEKNGHVWYQLFNDGTIRAEKVGEGNRYKPVGGGTYCVTSKYGIGYAVSFPYTVK